ncbi:MAG: zf-TFIIB domain-containing protein [Candidatus Hydrogenedentes bacterium]|nr:zf-TFIIB domain-containing protein [Candidatus Hydrogenedentota bacterium]
MCNDPMLVLEHQEVEIDFCHTCGGIWLDNGELELLLGAPDQSRAYLEGGATAAAKGERPRRCPICGVRMAKEVTRGTPPVVYDVCPKAHGLWYDKGELDRVLQQAAGQDHDDPVRAWLRGLFGTESHAAAGGIIA